MTAPIQEPNIYRHASGLQWGQNQLFRRPSPVTNTGLPYAVARTGSVEVEDTGTYYIVDLQYATFVSNSDLLQLIDDSPNTPEWGITIPADYVAQIYTWVERDGVAPDGIHTVSFVVSGAYSVSQYGPIHFNVSSPASRATLTDDGSGPDGIYQVEHMGDNDDWVVGIIHEWTSYTNGPKDFRYGISVTLLGSRPE